MEDNKENVIEEEKEYTESEVCEVCEQENREGENASADNQEEEKTPVKEKKTAAEKWKSVLSFILTIVITLIIILFINIYVIRISSVNGSSMESSYHSGQVVFMSNLPYIFSSPEIGDVVVFDSKNINPGERGFWDNYKDILEYNAVTMFIKKNQNKEIEHKYYIKRVIGVAGDTIEIKEDGLYRNGEHIQEDYIKDQNWGSSEIGKSWTVSEGCIFVMGDNRNASKDSRIIGEVSEDALIGKVLTKGDND